MSFNGYLYGGLGSLASRILGDPMSSPEARALAENVLKQVPDDMPSDAKLGSANQNTSEDGLLDDGDDRWEWPFKARR
jgi:hypothetical protein